MNNEVQGLFFLQPTGIGRLSVQKWGFIPYIAKQFPTMPARVVSPLGIHRHVVAHDLDLLRRQVSPPVRSCQVPITRVFQPILRPAGVCMSDQLIINQSNTIVATRPPDNIVRVASWCFGNQWWFG